MKKGRIVKDPYIIDQLIAKHFALQRMSFKPPFPSMQLK